MYLEMEYEFEKGHACCHAEEVGANVEEAVVVVGEGPVHQQTPGQLRVGDLIVSKVLENINCTRDRLVFLLVISYTVPVGLFYPMTDRAKKFSNFCI